MRSFQKFPGARTPLLLHALYLAFPHASILSRVMRSSLLETLNEDFIKTARAKGLTENQSLLRHGVRNALIPVFTLSLIHI